MLLSREPVIKKAPRPVCEYSDCSHNRHGEWYDQNRRATGSIEILSDMRCDVASAQSGDKIVGPIGAVGAERPGLFLCLQQCHGGIDGRPPCAYNGANSLGKSNSELLRY